MNQHASAYEPLPEDVIARVTDGERGAFEVVVRRYERPLRAWLATQSPPGVDVDELAQRSFVAAYENRERFQVGTDYAAWLFTIARYQLRTELTRLRRVADYQSRYAPDLLKRELERNVTDTPELLEQRLDCLKHCLDSLGDHMRRFIVWRYEEEIPLEEMANRSGRSLAAVKKQLWMLRRKLHTCIEARLIAEGESS